MNARLTEECVGYPSSAVVRRRPDPEDKPPAVVPPVAWRRLRRRRDVARLVDHVALLEKCVGVEHRHVLFRRREGDESGADLFEHAPQRPQGRRQSH